MRLPLAGVVLLLSAGCEKAAQARRCAEAAGDVAACRALAGDCTTIINSTCSGDCELGCMPDEAAGRCHLLPDTRCPADDRIFSNGRPGSLSAYPWKAKGLSQAALALSNQPISREAFERLAEKDRQELCGGLPRHPCTLIFDEALGRADCRLPPDPCARCELRVRPSKCIPVNKCSGVICL